MFDFTSRYYAIENATFVDPAGRTIVYKRRRFVPRASDSQTIAEIPLDQADRLDLLTARSIGIPELYWQLCDANNAMNPFDLTADDMIGRTLRLPQPQPPGSAF
jgi:hypothetical protein